MGISWKERMVMSLATLSLCSLTALAQQPEYPKEIRGYKVERRTVDAKKPAKKTKETSSSDSEADLPPDNVLRFGDPGLARVTPLGITFEIPLVVAPVRQKGHVDFLVFEEMFVNDTAVEIDEYNHSFDLPNSQPLTLADPIKVYIYLPHALLAAVDEWNDSKETWTVRGRIYVFGKFKKALFSFKRCIPVEVKVTMRNPLRQ